MTHHAILIPPTNIYSSLPIQIHTLIMQVPPESITFRHYNGTISLFSPHLPEVYDPRLQHLPGHITLATAEEYKSIDRPPIHDIVSSLSVDHVYLVGEGHSRDGRVKWESVVWNAGGKWRAEMGLDRKFFHVTISARDDHTLHKGIQSVIDRLGVDELVNRLEKTSVETMQEVFRSSRNGYTELECGAPSFVSHFSSMPQHLLHGVTFLQSFHSLLMSIFSACLWFLTSPKRIVLTGLSRPHLTSSTFTRISLHTSLLHRASWDLC